MNKRSNFKLFATCPVVKGISGAVIMDLQRFSFLEISLLLAEVLEISSNVSIDATKKHYHHQLDKGIDKFFRYLAKEEYGFFTSTPELFPPLKTKFMTPYPLHTAIVCIDSQSDYDIEKTFRSIIHLECQYVQIIADSIEMQSNLLEALNVFNESSAKIVELIIMGDELCVNQLLSEYNTSDHRIKIIRIGKDSNVVRNNVGYPILRINSGCKTMSELSENVTKDTFTCNLLFFEEALEFNVGLNRKLTIDSRGKVKNFFSHQTVFGDVRENSLHDVLSKDEFQAKWRITNDMIEKCKDCQYRYMCLSNSDIVQKNNKYYKLNSCDFNPYKNKWL